MKTSRIKIFISLLSISIFNIIILFTIDDTIKYVNENILFYSWCIVNSLLVILILNIISNATNEIGA